MPDVLTEPDAFIADPVLERQLFIDNEWRNAKNGKTFSLLIRCAMPGVAASSRAAT